MRFLNWLLFVALVIFMGSVWWQLREIRQELGAVHAQVSLLSERLESIHPGAKDAALLSADPSKRAIRHLRKAAELVRAGNFGEARKELDEARSAAVEMGRGSYRGDKGKLLEMIQQARKSVADRTADAQRKVKAVLEELVSKARES